MLRTRAAAGVLALLVALAGCTGTSQPSPSTPTTSAPVTPTPQPDDEAALPGLPKGVTLVSESTLTSDFAGFEGTKTEAAKKVGELIAKKAQDAGITAVVFDRGGNKYHGRVAAVAEGAREGGLAL